MSVITWKNVNARSFAEDGNTIKNSFSGVADLIDDYSEDQNSKTLDNFRTQIASATSAEELNGIRDNISGLRGVKGTSGLMNALNSREQSLINQSRATTNFETKQALDALTIAGKGLDLQGKATSNEQNTLALDESKKVANDNAKKRTQNEKYQSVYDSIISTPATQFKTSQEYVDSLDFSGLTPEQADKLKQEAINRHNLSETLNDDMNDHLLTLESQLAKDIKDRDFRLNAFDQRTKDFGSSRHTDSSLKTATSILLDGDGDIKEEHGELMRRVQAAFDAKNLGTATPQDALRMLSYADGDPENFIQFIGDHFDGDTVDAAAQRYADAVGSHILDTKGLLNERNAISAEYDGNISLTKKRIELFKRLAGDAARESKLYGTKLSSAEEIKEINKAIDALLGVAPKGQPNGGTNPTLKSDPDTKVSKDVILSGVTLENEGSAETHKKLIAAGKKLVDKGITPKTKEEADQIKAFREQIESTRPFKHSTPRNKKEREELDKWLEKNGKYSQRFFN